MSGDIGCSCGKKISSRLIRQHLEDEHIKHEDKKWFRNWAIVKIIEKLDTVIVQDKEWIRKDEVIEIIKED